MTGRLTRASVPLRARRLEVCRELLSTGKGTSEVKLSHHTPRDFATVSDLNLVSSAGTTPGPGVGRAGSTT
jgi:hypothetical protein